MSNNNSSFLGNRNDKVQVYKSMANYDMIGEMMNRQFGYSPKEFAASMRSMDTRVDATIGAWHVGNVFELHKDGTYGVVIAPIGDGTNSPRSVSLEGVEAKHFSEDLTRARKSATELEQKDLRKGITSNDPEFHYRNAVDQVADEYFTTYSLMKAQYLDSSHPKFGQEVGSAKNPKMAAPGETQHFGGPRDGQAVHGTGTAQAMAQNTKNENNSKRQKFASFDKAEDDDVYHNTRDMETEAERGASAIGADRARRGKPEKKNPRLRPDQKREPDADPFGSYHLDRHGESWEDRNERKMSQNGGERSYNDKKPPKIADRKPSLRGEPDPMINKSFAMSLLNHGRALRKSATGR